MLRNEFASKKVYEKVRYKKIVTTETQKYKVE